MANAEEEYFNTKEDTDELVNQYMDYLSYFKGAVYIAREMPKYAPVDYAVYKNRKLSFYLEVKIRRHEKGKYEDEKVPVSKFTFAYTFSKLFKVKTYLLVLWQDNVGVVDLENYSRIDSMTARHDRGEEYDLYAYYPSLDFAELPIWFEDRIYHEPQIKYGELYKNKHLTKE